MSGLHRNYVGAIERGEINPTFGTLLRVARGLRLSLPELVSLYAELEAERREDLRPDVLLGRPAGERKGAAA